MPTIFESLQNDRFVLIQAYCPRRSGELFPAEISVNRLDLSTENFLCFFIRDITQRKEAEEMLRTGHNAIQNSANGIAVMDLAQTLTYCNPALVTLLGYATADDLLGNHVACLLSDEPAAGTMLQAMSQGQPWNGELQVRRRDGGTVYAEASIAPNLNDDLELMGMVLSLLDISRQKRTQQALRERNEQMEEDLLMAREIQQAFLPTEYPRFPADATPATSILRFAHQYCPSGAVGGDFFDVLRISDTAAGIFVSDVMGHGPRAALVVATIRGLFEKLASVACDPGAFLTQLNRDLVTIFRQTGQLTFVTALYMVIDATTGRLTYASAGHPAPLLLRRNEVAVGSLPITRNEQGAALCLFPQSDYATCSCRMEEQDAVVLYTDGICEAARADRTNFDEEHILNAAQRRLSSSLDDILAGLVADARVFTGQPEFEDDVCLLGMELTRLAPAV